MDHLTKNGILSQWTPPRASQHNKVSKKRNQIYLDKVRSMMSKANLPISFKGYALETVAHLLNKVSSKFVDKTPYEI